MLRRRRGQAPWRRRTRSRACARRARRSPPWSPRPGTARRRCSRSGPRPTRVPLPGSLSTARDDDAVVFLRYIATAIHGVEPVPARGVRGVVGPRGFDMVHSRPAPRRRAGRAGPARWCWCSTICMRSPIPSCARRAHRARSNTSRRARRSRSRAGRSRRCRSPRWRARGSGARARRSRTSDWTTARPELLLEGGRSSSFEAERGLRPDRAYGRLAGRLVPRGALDAGRRAELGEHGRRSPVTTGSFPTTSASELLSRLPPDEAQVPQAHVRARSHERRPVRRA